MKARELWKRLLWKEFREGRWPALMSTVTMTASYTAAYHFRDSQSLLWDGFTVMAAGTMHLTLAIWGASKGNERRVGAEFEFSHLPTNPAIGWTFSVVIPTLAFGFIGLWYGFLAQVTLKQYSTIPMPVVGALDLALTYTISYFAASITSFWAGLLIGILRLLTGTLIPVWQTDLVAEKLIVLHSLRVVGGAMLGALVLAWLRGRLSAAARKAASLGAALLVMYGPTAITGVPTWLRELSFPENTVDKSLDFSMGATYTTYDRAVLIEDIRINERWDPRVAMLRVQDRLRGKTHTRKFRRDLEIIGALRDGRVFLVQQLPADKNVRILQWSYLTNQVRVRARFAAKEGALAENYGLDHVLTLWPDSGAISPDGRYVLIELGPTVGKLPEVWIVDLVTGRGAVVVLQMWPIASIAWTRDRLLVGGLCSGTQVDLSTFRAKPFEVRGL